MPPTILRVTKWGFCVMDTKKNVKLRGIFCWHWSSHHQLVLKFSPEMCAKEIPKYSILDSKLKHKNIIHRI